MDRLAESSWLAGFARASLSLVLASSSCLPAIAFADPPQTAPAPIQPEPVAQPQPQPVAQPQPVPQPYPPDGSRQLHDPFGRGPAPYPTPTVQPQPYPQPPPPQPVYYYPQPYGPQVQPVAPPPPVKPPRKKGMGLLVGGFAMFGGTYLFTVLGGAIAIDTGNPEVGRALMVPIAGPFTGFARLMSSDPADPHGTLALGICGMVFSGIFQLGGLAMGFAGVGLLARSRAEARYGVSFTGDRLQLRF